MSTIDAEVVESALDGLGVPWKRRETDWLVTAGPRWPYPVALTANGTRLRIEAVLASWDELGARERAALGLLLGRAEGGLPGVRFGLGEREAMAWTDLADDASERAVTEAVARVATGARLLAREAGALLSPGVAETYLHFFGAIGETTTHPDRN